MKPSGATLVAVLLGLVCVAIVFWPSTDPSQRYWSRVTWHVTQDQMIPVEQARDRAAAVVRQAEKMSAEGTLTPEKLLELQTELVVIETHAEQHGPHPRPGAIYVSGMSSMSALAGIRSHMLRSPAYFHADWSKRMLNNQKWLDAQAFKAKTTESNTSVVATRYALRYVLSFPFAFLMYVALLMRHGRSGVRAVVEASSFRCRILFYPVMSLVDAVTAFEFTSADYQRSLRRLVSFVGYATAASISLFCGGNVLAQTVKKDNKKKGSLYTLQLDTRIVDPTSAPPTGFNRTTFNSKQWVAETISTITSASSGPSWYNEAGGGYKVFATPRSVFSLNAYVAHASGGVRKILAGGQYFRGSPRVVIAIPVMRIEKTLRGKIAVNFAANPLFRLAREGILSRFALSPDLSWKKVWGGGQSWNVGLGFAVFPRQSKGDRVEVAVLRNSAGQSQVRGRYVLNFAF